MRRREFFGSSPFILLGARLACAGDSQAQVDTKGPELKEELTAEEIAVVNNSTMAKDLDNFFGKGFS